MLTQFTNAFQDDWDIFLPVVTWAYHTTINSATGYTPFRAVFGREAKSPSDAWIDDFAKHHNIGIDNYITKLTTALQHIWSDIAKRTFNRQQKEAQRNPNPRSRVFIPYHPGEQFYFKSVPRRAFKNLEDEKWHKVSAKMQFRFSGPHTVTQIINPVTYKARIDGVIRTVHVNRMKRNPRKRPPSQETPPTILPPQPDPVDDPLMLMRILVDNTPIRAVTVVP